MGQQVLNNPQLSPTPELLQTVLGFGFPDSLGSGFSSAGSRLLIAGLFLKFKSDLAFAVRDQIS